MLVSYLISIRFDVLIIKLCSIIIIFIQKMHHYILYNIWHHDLNDADAGICCREYPELGNCVAGVHDQPDQPNNFCHQYCITECKGGVCKFRKGKNVCHCLCWFFGDDIYININDSSFYIVSIQIYLYNK